MKTYQKALIMAATPTISVLHSKWIAHLMGAEWSDTAQAFSLVMVFASLTVAAAVLFGGSKW